MSTIPLKSNFRETIKATGLANLYQANSVKYLLSLESLKTRYLKRPENRRSAKVSAAFIAADSLRNSTRRVFAWYISAARAGFPGVVCTNDQLAEIIAAATDSKLSGRTISRVNAELSRRGWISIKSLPTGSKVQTNGGRWLTRKVNQVRLTPQALLISECIPVCGKSLPSPKRRATLTGAIQGESSFRFPPELAHTSTLDQKPRVETLKQQGTTPALIAPEISQADRPAMQVEGKATCQVRRPSAPAPDSEHKSNATRGQRPRKPLNKRLRSRKPRNWAALRLLFLGELEKNLDGCQDTNERAEIKRLARLQTALNFPPLVPCPVDWNKIIFSWGTVPWAARRRYLRQVLIPELAAAVSGLLPIDRGRLNNPSLSRQQREQAAQEIETREICAAWQVKISSEILRGQYPRQAKEYAADHAFQLDTYAKLINCGQIAPAEVDPQVLEVFRNLADMIGAD